MAEGSNTVANGFASHAEGEGNTASGRASHVEGGGVDQLGNLVHNLASGSSSHAEGVGTTASGIASHAEGGTTDLTFSHGPQALGDFSHAEGGADSSADLPSPVANAVYSHVEGSGTSTTATALYAHAEGAGTYARAIASHAQGTNTIADGNSSHAEGEDTESGGRASHAEGGGSFAGADFSHAEGLFTEASGIASHAEGSATEASGIASHAEGISTKADGVASHAEGSFTIANGSFSHAEGLSTSTNNHIGAHIMGQYGNADADFSWHLANGTPSTPGLAARIDGNLAMGIAANGWVSGPADYAEMFETLDGNPIDVGYFVTLKGEKIRKANPQDTYILGITSATPGVLGDAAELEWKDKWVKDEWGRWIFQEVRITSVTDKEGHVIVPERTEIQKIVNPEYDASKDYLSRSKRSEWVAVGLLGKILVRDDGTCIEDGYCRPNDDGIASASDIGYRVMKRTGPNQILILFK